MIFSLDAGIADVSQHNVFHLPGREGSCHITRRRMNELVSADGARGRKRRLEPNNQGHEISSNYSNNNAIPRPKFPSPPLGQPSGSASGKDRCDDGSDPYCEDGDLFDIDDLPNDTMATVMCLQQEFYKGQGNRPDGSASEDGRPGGGGERTGVILQHQIYTILANRTAVDRELTAMRKDNVLRTFRLNTGREDWGLMSTEHYLRLIHNVFGKTQIEVGTKDLRSDLGGSSRYSNRGAPPAGKVLEHLVRTIARAYASRKEVSSAVGQVSLESASRQGGDGDPSKGQEGNGVVYAAVARGADGQRGLLENGKSLADGKKRKHVRVQEQEEDEQGLASLKKNEENVLAIASELIRAGFLLPRRDVGREEAYWFSLPQLGKVTASITRGRKEITRALKRTRYKEMRRSALEAKNPARSTGLPISFHIRDLLGLGIIKQLDTPSGAFLRVVHDAEQCFNG